MLRMRLQRFGRKHEPYYRVVIAQKTAPVKGKYLSSVGHYNPVKEILEIDKDRALGWLNKGVTPSNRVSRLLTKLGLKHKLVVVKTFRAKSKQELEQAKQAEEAKKSQELAQKEKAKQEFEAKQKQEAAKKIEEKVAEETKQENTEKQAGPEVQQS